MRSSRCEVIGSGALFYTRVKAKGDGALSLCHYMVPFTILPFSMLPFSMLIFSILLFSILPFSMLPFSTTTKVLDDPIFKHLFTLLRRI